MSDPVLGEARLAAIQAAADAASEGEWRTTGYDRDDGFDGGYPVLGGGAEHSAEEHLITWVGTFCNSNADRDADFIALARSAVPELLAHVGVLQADNQRLRDENAEMRRLRACLGGNEAEVGR